MVSRFELIQYLIDTLNYQRYLELGCRMTEFKKLSIDSVNCKHKDSVDVNRNGNNYVMTTDDFFKGLNESDKWDIIFIDANHDKEYVKRDIENSLKHLTVNGCIICHDVSPPEEKYLVKRFCSSAWETWADLRATRNDLQMYVMPTSVDPVGVGVIRFGYQVTYDAPIEYTWNFLNSNRTSLLNIVDIDTFKTTLNK